MNHKIESPRWARRLLRWLAPPDRADDVVGDFEEAHRERVQRTGRIVARGLTTLDALDMAAALIHVRIQREAVEAGLGKAGPASQHVEYERGDMGTIVGAWIKDLAHATRSLGRAPVFTVVTVATLAVALGSNAAIFSVLNAVVLKSLPFSESSELVSIRGTAPGSDLPEIFGVPEELYVEYIDQGTLITDLARYAGMQATMRTDDQVDRLFMARVTPSFFTVLRVSPILGRLPTEDDGEGAVVISHWLWTQWFGEDPAVLNRSYEIAGQQREIVGVMGPDFSYPDRRTALWVSYVIDTTELGAASGGFGWPVIGRMAPGANPESIADQLAPLTADLPDRYPAPPQYRTIMERHRPIVRSLRSETVGEIAGPLWLLLGTVGVVLLIACANVANLFIARSEGKRDDLAVRHALGAGRNGLIRAQMTEALVLAFGGAVGGVLVALVGVPLLTRAAPEGIPRLDQVAVDPGTLIFTGLAALVAAIAFGFLPALRFSRPGVVGNLRPTGRRVSVGRSSARDALVVVQTASALVLLVASGLLLQSFWKLSQVDPGFDPKDIFSFQIAPTGDELIDGPSYARFHYDFMDRIAALPDVQSVGVVNHLPLDEGADDNFFETERTVAAGDEGPLLEMTFTGGDYFESMGIDILAGQKFNRVDEANGEAVAIVSESAAELLWPGEDPLGQKIRPLGAPMWWTVVGLAEDVFINNYREESAAPLIYLPLVGPVADLYAVSSPAYVVKTPRAETITEDIRALVRQAAPESPMYRIFTMKALVARSMGGLTFIMITLGTASAIALILGAVGLYGVLSYVVSQRTREIGVRMALGAEAPDVRRMVVKEGSRMAAIGLAIGLALAFAATRILEGLLFGVQASDPVTFAVVALMMLAVALLASYIPARRASSVDPMRSLRME